MRRMILVFCSVWTMGLVGCVDNEQSFYIEHAKMLPDPPDCSVSAGDDEATVYGLNLFLASSAPVTFYSVTNAVMSQEDYGRLRAESNGIFVDGYEIYTLIPGQGAFGGTEYVEYNTFIAAESSGLLAAQIMSSDVIQMLQTQQNCPVFSPADMGEFIANAHFGTVTYPQIAQAVARMDGMAATPIPSLMYAVVRFLGHTQGGKEVETQEFSIALDSWCGIRDGWTPCINDLCHAFCNSDASDINSCTPGLTTAGADVPRCYDYIKDAYTFNVDVMRETGELDANDQPIMAEVSVPICDACDASETPLRISN